MPQEFNNDIVVTASEVLPWFNSLNNLQQHIRNYKDKNYGIKKVQRGGNGREMLIAFDSLPKEIQNSLGDPRKNNNILELFFKFDADATTFYQQYQFEDGSYLSTLHQEQYITNASVLKALVRLREARIHERKIRKGSMKGLMSSLLNDAQLFNQILLQKYYCKHSLPNSEKRFKEALNEFEKGGYESVISKKLKNTNAQKVSDAIISLLNSLFAKQIHKPTRTEVSRQYEAFLAGYLEVIDPETGELFSPQGLPKLSDASIVSWLGKWEHKIGTYASRTGNRQKLIAQFRPHASMKQPKFAGSIISIDDRQPPFTYGNNKRLWFYMGIDLASGAFTAWVSGPTKEGIIVEFYREMVRNYAHWGVNLPAELEAEMSLNSGFMNGLLREGNMFQHVHVEANNARAKRIERYFGKLRYELEKTRLGWLPRPTALSESNQFNEEKVPVVPYNEIVEGCLQDIITWNNMPHNVDPTISKFDYFLRNQNPNLKPTNYHGILPYIGHKTHTSCNAGIIRMNNQEFLLGDKGIMHSGAILVNKMKEVEGEDIEICWLDAKDGSVLKAFVYLNGKYICEAIAKPIYHRAKIERTIEDEENISLMSSYTATIDAYMKQRKNNIENVILHDMSLLTINNNFTLPGAEAKNKINNTDVEILPDLQDEEIPVYINKRNIKDRF